MEYLSPAHARRPGGGGRVRQFRPLAGDEPALHRCFADLRAHGAGAAGFAWGVMILLVLVAVFSRI